MASQEAETDGKGSVAQPDLSVADILRVFPDSEPVAAYCAGWPLTRHIGAGELGEICYYLDLPAAEVLERLFPSDNPTENN